jgi:hypothetical protein
MKGTVFSLMAAMLVDGFLVRFKILEKNFSIKVPGVWKLFASCQEQYEGLVLTSVWIFVEKKNC